MMARRSTRQDIKRAIQAASEAGFEAAELVIGSNGDIRLISRSASSASQTSAEAEIARHFNHARK